MPNDSLQDSEVRKSAWYEETSRKMPIGTPVKILASDLAVYVGKVGVVIGYDVGDLGEYPLITVKFSEQLADGFYDSELQLLSEVAS